MLKDNKIWVANAGDKELYLLPKMANRHGLIAGATGTGKTITLKVMAEAFSDLGVPVFLSDVKGDLTGMCVQGTDSEDMQKRIANFKIDNFEYKGYPTMFWDCLGENGTPLRMKISEVGPILLARLLNLSEVQEGVLNIVFKVADDQGLLLYDLKDLRAMLKFVSDNKEEYTTLYGNIATSSIGAIQRALLAFEQEGCADVFGEPSIDVKDWIKTDANGKGIINVLEASKLFQSPTTYGTFLLWMLTELYEKLPEVGDLDKPRLVFFFDEAHTLFDDTPKALHEKVSQVVKLIRSKGIGIYFITQVPSDIPDDVLGQLSNKVQHGLRAYTPAEMKAVKAAAMSYRENPDFNTEEALQALGVGEALVSFLDEKGVPSVVENAKILPPQSLMGAASPDVVSNAIKSSELELKYRQSVDSESAYEIIMKASGKLGQAGDAQANTAPAAEGDAAPLQTETAAAATVAAAPLQAEAATAKTKKATKNLTEELEEEIKEKKKSTAGSTVKKVAEQAVKNAASSAARSVSTNFVNSLLGTGTVSSAETIGKRAATNALSSVMRSGATSLVRGLFGNLK